MALIHPDHAKTSHWKGALQARLIRAPLEQFLASNQAKIAQGGSRDSDNLARATVLMVEGGLREYFDGRAEGLADTQHASIGRLACLVTRTLAAAISQPDVWRIPALLSAAQLLTPWIGLNAAAYASASAIHRYSISLTLGGVLPEEVEVCALVSAALKHRGAASAVALSQVISTSLSSPASGQGSGQATDASLVLPRAIAGV
jgi:hypothetical protein